MSHRRLYRQIWRRARYLPLQTSSLERLWTLIRSRFTRDRVPSKKLAQSFINLADTVLVHESWDSISKIWDLIYKNDKPEWIKQFVGLNHRYFETVWPQVHLISHISSDQNVLKPYYNAIQSQQNPLFTLGSSQLEFKLVKEYAEGAKFPIPEIYAKASKLYKFISQHQSRITKAKLASLDAVYHTSSIALPLHSTLRDEILHQKVAAVKAAVVKFCPMSKSQHSEIVALALSRPPAAINPNFHRYMYRKRCRESTTKSSIVRSTLRSKKLVPTSHNIAKLFRAYAANQIYIDQDGEYKLSLLESIYLHQHSMWHESQMMFSSKAEEIENASSN